MMPISFPRWLITIGVITTIILLAAGNWFYHLEKHALQQQAEDELQAIAQLKTDQIVAWRAERLGDAALLTENPFLIDGVARWLANPQTEDRDNILAQFQALKTNYHYDNVELVDVEGNIRLSLNGESSPLHEEALKTLAAALHNHQPMLTDLHRGPGNLAPHIGAIAPLFTGSGPSAQPLGAIILQSDASQFLYPLIQSWPTPSRSAETLLVRRDGDSVLFLNELRHQKGTALTLRIPLEQNELPAAKAAQGYEGITQGKDYRGVAVVAAVQGIPDSPWFIVSKVDKTEIFADWRLYSRLILGLFTGAVVTVGTTGGAIWQRNQKRHYQTLLKVEREQQESEARYRTTLLSIGDGVIITDAEERVVLLNPVAETLTGWPQSEAYGKPLEEIFHIVNEDTRQTVENPVRRVIREGTIVGLANHTLLINRDGREIPITDSGAPIHAPAENITGVVLVFRDQTEERAAHKALKDSEAYVRTILDNLPVGVAVNSVFPDVAPSYINDNFLKCYRTTREALAEPNAFWEAAYQDAEFREIIKRRVLADVASGDPARMYWEDVPITREGEETTFISATNTPIHGTDLMLSTVWDTTDRKRAEESLRESEERFRRAVADAPFPMLIHAEDGEILTVNQAWTDITGYTHADIPTIDAWMMRAYGMRRQIIQEGIKNLYTMHGPRAEGESTIVTHSGEKRIWDFSSSPIGRLPDGRRLVLSMAIDVTERKQAEEALRQRESTLDALLNAPVETVALLDQQGNILRINENGARRLGSTPEELVGRNIYTILPPEVAQTRKALIDGVLQTGDPIHFEDSRSGRYYTNSVYPVFDKTSEQMIGIAIYASDITERKQTESDLRTLSQALEHSPSIVYITDRDGRLIYTNPKFTEITGYTIDEAIGHLPRILDPGKISREEHEERWHTIRSGQEWRGEFQNRKKNGEPFWESASISSIKDETGAISHFVLVMEDITERRQAEQQLRELNETLEQRVIERTEQLHYTKERIETILNSSSDIIILCRPDGRIEQVNPAFDDAFHCDPDRAYNRNLAWLIAPEHKEELELAFAAAVEKRLPQRLETVATYQNNQTFEVDVALSPIVQHDRRVSGVVCSLRDITERKRMEAKLLQMLEHEMELSELKSRYVSMAAHDLRNPLAVIQSTVSLIRQYGDRLTSEKAQEKYDHIETSIKVMVDMLDDILILGKVESGKLSFEPAPLAVIAFCKNLVMEISQAAGAPRNIDFHSQDNCRIAMLDAKLLRHILGNLLSNAIKYSPADRPVTFTVHCAPDQIVFHIQDQGIGIPKDDQKQLFETFHRAHNAKHLPGTGLGLAIVKQSVDLHGGTISFESEEGIGTSFTVMIPQTSSEKADEENAGY